MASITDEQLVAILRPFVRAASPVLDTLREGDPLGLRARADAARARGETLPELAHVKAPLRHRLVRRLSSVKAPGTPRWAEMTPDQRITWWINRVGRITALLASIPGLGGALASRLPVRDAVGVASQGLLLCALAGELGLDDNADRVRLLAAVLFGRDIDARLAAGEVGEQDPAEEDSRTAELTSDLDRSGRSKASVRGLATTLWRLGRYLSAVTDELEKRPRGRFWHRWLGMLPGVGMIAAYLGERWGLKRAAKHARKWVESDRNARIA